MEVPNGLARKSSRVALRLLAACCLLIAAACSKEPPPQKELLIGAAASVAPAVEELGKSFEASTGCRVVVSRGATGTLAAQVRNGAPLDLFFSADAATVDALAKEGIIDPASVGVFARGALIIWQRNDAPAVQTFADVTPGGSRRIAVANPETAPFGKAAVEALRSIGWKDDDLRVLVRGESVAQAAELARSGNVDLAFVSPSVVKAGEGREIAVPEGAYSAIECRMGLVSGTKNRESALEFLKVAAGPEAAKILTKHRMIAGASENTRESASE